MDFHVLGGQKTNKKTKKWNEISQRLFPRALSDIKTIRKVDGDMFANVPPEKLEQIKNKSKTKTGNRKTENPKISQNEH